MEKETGLLSGPVAGRPHQASQPINRKCYSQYPVPNAAWDMVGGCGGVSFQMCRLAGVARSQDIWPPWLPFLPSI